MAIPDFEAYSRNIPAPPLAAGLQTGLQTYGTMQRLAEERRQQEMQQQQFASIQQLRAHQIATSQLNNAQLGHSYLAHRLADLHDASASDKPIMYQNILNDAANLGISTGNLPAQYNESVKNLAASAYAATPSAIAQRKMAQQSHLAEMQARARIQAARIRAGGVPGAAVPSVGGQIITGVGQQVPGAVTPRAAVVVAPQAGAAPAQVTTAAAVPGAQVPAVQAAQAVPGAGVQIRPTVGLTKSYEKAAGQAFVKEQQTAAQASEAASHAVNEIDAFVRGASKAPIPTGPLDKYVLPYLGMGQLTQKAASRLSLALLKAQKFSRPTNYELKFTGKGTLGLGMKPEAWHILAPQLKIYNQRKAEYEQFLNAANMAGIANLGIARRIWDRYKEENPLINPDGSTNPRALPVWRRYLTPQAIQTELSLQPTTKGGERTLLGPDGKRYTISELRKRAAMRRGK